MALRELADGAPVTSRLKRFETTIEKLRRHKSRLSSIEDIAGCRVVLPTMRHQHELLDRIRRELDVVRERDYQANPRGGYRALHAVVRAGGPLVEVQLRTDLEDQWANTVERLAGKLDPEIKYNDGPPGLHRRLEIISKIISELDEIKAIRHRLDLVEDNPGESRRIGGFVAHGNCHAIAPTSAMASGDGGCVVQREYCYGTILQNIGKGHHCGGQIPM